MRGVDQVKKKKGVETAKLYSLPRGRACVFMRSERAEIEHLESVIDPPPKSESDQGTQMSLRATDGTNMGRWLRCRDS
jgi:hypothetical protein